jgi:molybdopterin-biosynthesis enzyme MoeA-like protein
VLQQLNSLNFGLLVIGDEILAGRRQDTHFAAIGDAIRQRGFNLAWLRILSDSPDYLVAELKRTMAEGIPVFSCGGIGATPDDYTRACAAKAAGVPLVRHPEAAAVIEDKFGEEAYPIRIRMADLPEGSELIPNPYNRIPGFSIKQHYFMPGFPDMAHPMAAWVLDNWYAAEQGSQQQQYSVWVKGATETALIGLMESLTQQFPQHKLFSLPRLGEEYLVELGYRGNESISEPFDALLAGLRDGGFDFQLDSNFVK